MNNPKSTAEKFIAYANDVHNHLYDYSKVEYVNVNTKVCIIHPEFGEFWQAPADHLSGPCHPKIGIQKIAGLKRLITEKFIKKAKKLGPVLRTIMKNLNT